MSSELELLRQHITDLEADNIELKRELKARTNELEKTIQILQLRLINLTL